MPLNPVTTALLMAKGPSGDPVVVRSNAEGELITTASIGAQAAFGELLVQTPNPLAQASFVYGIQPAVMEQVNSGSGSSASASSMATASTGATADSTAALCTRALGYYDAGLGLESICAGMFTASPLGTESWMGLLDVEDGCAFGVQGGQLALLHRRGGQRHIVTLDVTVAAGGAGSIDVELNGTTVNVPIAGALSIGEVITEIANADYSGAGGWQTAPFGSGVSFIAIHADVRGGAYSFTDNATGAVGAFAAADATGVVATDSVVLSAAWDFDKADGNGTLPLIDPTKLNDYRCVPSYTGAIGIKYSIWDPTTFSWVLVHAIPWGNAQVVPLFGNPTVPLCIMADNLAVADNASATSSSMAVHLQGSGHPQSHSSFESDTATLAATAASEEIIAAYHVKSGFAGRTTKLLTAAENVSYTNDTGKQVAFTVYLNPEVVGVLSYTDVPGTGLWEVAKPAAGIATVVPGTELFKLTTEVARLSGKTVSDITGAIAGGSFIVITSTTVAGGGGDVTAAANWRVEF